VHFAFTAGYHYLFPQLTMGLALLVVVLKGMALRGDEAAATAARFWLRLFGLCFLFGVVTGIPLEFQFGTSWSRFSEGAGAVVGQTLALEGVYAFFLEASFLYLLLHGEGRLSPRAHFGVAVLLLLGSWASGYFIVATNAFMQHPVGHELRPDGSLGLASLSDLLVNPWALAQYLHTMTGAVITGCVTMAAISALWLLRGVHEAAARRSLSVAVVLGVVACFAAAMPTGDWQAKLVAEHQPVTFAAMEGHFHTEDGAGLVLLGQPDMESLELDNAFTIPKALSFLTHQRWDATIPGLTEFDRELWPDQVELLYYAYHVMAGLGSLLMALMTLALWRLVRGRLHASRGLLWALLLALPFPYIANTAGWMTAELGRQPWIIHGVMRTADAHSAHVSAGNALFSLLGFMGLYALLSVVFGVLALRLVGRGPGEVGTARRDTRGDGDDPGSSASASGGAADDPAPEAVA
jgi:cytochrome d ubiquinol oxidase subunit I